MSGGVKSARRVVEVFEYFAARRAPATLSEVAHALGYPPSSTFALLNTLKDLGYLDYSRQHRTFVPTVRAALLGIWVNDALLADGTIVQLMYRLRDQTGCNAVLGIQSGLQVQYVQVVKGGDPGSRTDVATGAVRPLLRSAMGQVILTLKSRAELRTLVARANALAPGGQQVRLADVTQAVDQCRERGWAASEGLFTPGSGIIAMLLAAPAHQPPMVLGLSNRIPALRERGDEFVQALQDVVRQHREHMEALPAKFGAA